jgi:hypothetical protein
MTVVMTVSPQVSLFGDASAMEGFGHEEEEAVSIADLVRSAAAPRGASRKAAAVAAAAASARAELKPVWHDAEDDDVEVEVVRYVLAAHPSPAHSSVALVSFRRIRRAYGSQQRAQGRSERMEEYTA